MLDWPEYGKLLVALWALVHPLGAIPIFLSLTEHRPAERRHIGFVAATAVGVILIACVFVGQALLQAFGIHIPSFRIAGGLLILFVALAMMQTPGHGTQEAPADPQGSIHRQLRGGRPARHPNFGRARRHQHGDRLCASERLAGPSSAHLRHYCCRGGKHLGGAQARGHHCVTDRAYRDASLHADHGTADRGNCGGIHHARAGRDLPGLAIILHNRLEQSCTHKPSPVRAQHHRTTCRCNARLATVA